MISSLVVLNLPLFKFRSIQIKKVLFICFSEKQKKLEVKKLKMMVAADTKNLPQSEEGNIRMFIEVCYHELDPLYTIYFPLKIYIITELFSKSCSSWNPKVYHHVYGRPSLDSALSCLNSSYITYFSEISDIILCPVLYMSHPDHPSFDDSSNLFGSLLFYLS